MSGWISTLDAAAMDPAQLRGAVRTEMARAKVLRIVGAQPGSAPLDFWQAVGDVLGRRAERLEDSVSGEQTAADGGWMDVRFEPDRLDTYRHANVGQPLHTDGAYSSAGQDIGLFFLERQAEAGGESLFLDAETIVERLGAEDPELLARLMSTPVAFGKGSTAGTTSTILYRKAGRRKVNWNWFRVLPGQGEAIERLREDFRLLLERLVDEHVATATRLQSGDAVFFRDDEVLHGRQGYTAKVSGDRLLWKTYFTADTALATVEAA